MERPYHRNIVYSSIHPGLPHIYPDPLDYATPRSHSIHSWSLGLDYPAFQLSSPDKNAAVSRFSVSSSVSLDSKNG